MIYGSTLIHSDELNYYASVIEDGFQHHGILGQKWGVRRFQDKNGRLTLAGKQRLKDLKVQKTIDQYVKSGKAKVGDLESYKVAGLTTMTTPTGEQYVSGLMEGHDFDWQEGMLTPEGFKPVASIMKENISMFDSYKYDSPEFSELNSKLDNFELPQDLVSQCNPGFGNSGTTQNCAKCSATLELNRRGIIANAGRQTYPSSVDAMSYWFKNAQRVDYDSDNVEEALRSYGRKTSGTIAIQYPNGNGGHAMHWTNDGNGKFSIQDGQNGRIFDSVDDMMNTYGADRNSKVSTFRLDNCEPDFDALASDSVVRLTGDAFKVRNKNNGRIVDRW